MNSQPLVERHLMQLNGGVITNGWRCLPNADECLTNEGLGVRAIRADEFYELRHAIGVQSFLPLAQWQSTHVRAFFGVSIVPGARRATCAMFAYDPWGGVALCADLELAFLAFLSAAEWGTGLEDEFERKTAIAARKLYWSRRGSLLEPFLAGMRVDHDAWCFDFPSHWTAWGACSNAPRSTEIAGLAVSRSAAYWRDGKLDEARDAINLVMAEPFIQMPNAAWLNAMCRMVGEQRDVWPQLVQAFNACDWSFGRIPWSEHDPAWDAPVQLVTSPVHADGGQWSAVKTLSKGQALLAEDNIREAWSSATLVRRAARVGLSEAIDQYSAAGVLANACMERIGYTSLALEDRL